MGMFDEIVCDMPLPGTVPKWIEPGHRFQTKDTPEQYLRVYVIGEDGTFSDPEFTGDIVFYTSNFAGSWGPCTYTTNGEDFESVEFLAKVVDGKVMELKQTEYGVGPALPSRAMSMPARPSDEDVARWRARDKEPLLGRKLYVMWGGDDKGYHVEVVAEDDKEICVRALEDHGRNKKGKIETMHRGRGNTLFDSEEEAFAHKKARDDEFNTAKAEFEEYAKVWRAARGIKEPVDGPDTAAD